MSGQTGVTENEDISEQLQVHSALMIKRVEILLKAGCMILEFYYIKIIDLLPAIFRAAIYLFILKFQISYN